MGYYLGCYMEINTQEQLSDSVKVLRGWEGSCLYSSFHPASLVFLHTVIFHKEYDRQVTQKEIIIIHGMP